MVGVVRLPQCHAYSPPTQVDQKSSLFGSREHRKKRIMISVELTDFQSELEPILSYGDTIFAYSTHPL